MFQVIFCNVKLFTKHLRNTIRIRNAFTNAAKNGAILEQLSSRTLLRVSGPDASSFLQGLVTNDMSHLQSGQQSIYALFLNTSGRVLYDTIIYKTDGVNDFLVECDSQITEDLKRHLNTFRVRKKVVVSLTGLDVWCMFSTDREQSFLGRVLKNSVNQFEVYKDPRLDCLGYRIITSKAIHSDNLKQIYKDIEFTKDISYEEYRYNLGVGEGVQNLPIKKCFPLECNCDYLHGVSFQKGCYIGQELTARTYHTGVVRKRLMPLHFHQNMTNTILPPDAEIKTNEGIIVGKLRGVVNQVGLGLLRVEKVLPELKLLIGDCYSCSSFIPPWWPKERYKNK